MKNKIWYILITFMVILCSYTCVFASSDCVHVFNFSKMECERCGEVLTLNAGIDGRAAVANGPRLIENKPYSANFIFNNKIDIKNRIECKIIDEKCRIKQFTTMNGNPVQLYYDGKFIVEAQNVDTVLEEKITTYDGKEWTIRWTGSDVVEYSQNEEGKWIIIDHYNEKEKIFDEYYVSTKVAKETCEEFTGLECWYDVSEEYGKLFFYYINGTIGSGSSSVLEAIKDSNGEWFVSIKSLNSDIWMHVVNH